MTEESIWDKPEVPDMSNEVFEYLNEGNNKNDLIHWVWELLSQAERDALLDEVKLFNGESND